LLGWILTHYFVGFLLGDDDAVELFLGVLQFMSKQLVFLQVSLVFLEQLPPLVVVLQFLLLNLDLHSGHLLLLLLEFELSLLAGLPQQFDIVVDRTVV
jgi:hypothetical protein